MMRISTVLLSSILLLPTTTTSQTMAEAGNNNQQNAAPKVQYVSFLEILPEALTLDQSLEIASLGLDAAKETAVASWSAWYPKADITLNQAEQFDVKPAGTNAGATSPGMTGANGSGSSNQRYNPTEAKLKITQKLWDFGETTATIKTSQLSAEMAEIGLKSAENQSILRAAQAYIGLKKAYARYRISFEAEQQLRQQTGLQDFRVSRGATVGTDVLQAKNALAGAMTARVAAEGAYKRAQASFEKTFGIIPENVDALLPIGIPNLLIPETEEAFREAVLNNGDQLKRARISYDMAMVDRNKAAAANFLPELNLTAEMNYKGDASGTLGGKTEYIGKIELTWPLELFGTQINSYRAAKIRGKSAEVTYAQAVRSLEEGISSSWINFELAALNRSNVQNQVVIAEQFLRLAQMEVQQGRGQMMLVMNAQNALINARKALQDNTSDYAVQIYNLLAQMGELSLENLQEAAAKEAELRQKAIDEYRKRVEEAAKNAEASEAQ